jgi:hypothetical protein
MHTLYLVLVLHLLWALYLILNTASSSVAKVDVDRNGVLDRSEVLSLFHRIGMPY